MSRRKVGLRIEPVLAGILMPQRDELADSVLVAAADLMREYGLRRWTMEDVADRAGLGRTTLYRTFADRDELVHAVLARELRDTIATIEQATSVQESIEDKVVAGGAAALAALSTSIVDRLIQTDPATVLPFLTVHAGPLLAIAREAIATQIRTIDPAISSRLATEIGEAAARLGLSFVLVRDTVVAIDDPDALREYVRVLVQPILRPASASPRID
jgi:AcrR family transcriptional regulator